MEYNSTAIVVEPHQSINKDIWEQFVCEFPLCSKQYKLPENGKDRYKFISALMIANILDILTSWQLLKKLQDVQEVLLQISNLKDYSLQIEKSILNLITSLHTITNNLQPFDYRQFENNQQSQQKIQIVRNYLQKQRDYIYSFLKSQDGIDTLFKLSRGIALCLYIKNDNQNKQIIANFINSLSREDILNRLCSDDFEINSNNIFILEDYVIVAISHLLSIPIHFFLNRFDSRQNYLQKRRIHQQQSQEKTIAFLFQNEQNNCSVRILSSTQNIIYIQNIIKNPNYINQSQAIVDYMKQIIESILNQAINDFQDLNKFWIIKMLQIIKHGEVEALITNRQPTEINQLFSKESQNLFQILNLDSKLHQEFLNNLEYQLNQAEDCFEKIVISSVTLIRDQIIETINNYKKNSSYSESNLNFQKNQTPSQFQQQKKLNQAGRLIAKDLDNDIPENSDSSEGYEKSQAENQHSAIQRNISDELAQLKPPKHKYQEIKFRSDIFSQQGSSNSNKQANSNKKRQKSVENKNFEASLNFQNDYLISNQNRAQSDLNNDSLHFEPKKQIINQTNKNSSSQIMRQSAQYEQQQMKNQQLQNEISEVLNESKSEISMMQKFFCPICFTEIFQSESIRNLHDDHYVCKSCLEDWIKVKFNAKQWNFKFFKCPIQLIEGEVMKPCQHIIDQQEIKNALTSDEFNKLTERARKHGIIDIICPNEQCLASIKGMPPQNSNEFLCPKCNHKICWVCKKIDHGRSKCPQRLDEIKLALQDERVSCCPGCLEIYMKNEGCEHVSCTNCLIEFCFACSAHRPPIIAHGAHYHRVGCKYRAAWWKDQAKTIENLDEEFTPDICEYCMRNNHSCPRPMPLEDFKNLAHINF